MSETNSTPRHAANDHEASNGAGTAGSAEGESLDHPVLDGSTEHYGEEGQEKNARYGQDDPALIRHPETSEESAPTDEH